MSVRNEQPRISIVTPSFNQGRFLEDCILSVLDQKYPNLEYIIIDGGSSDQSVQIIRSYEDKLASWVSEKDGGQSDGINKGFRKCTGELVAWINADDYYLPGALQIAADAYRSNPSAPFFFGRCLRVDERMQTKGEYVSAPKLIFNREALILGLNYIAQPATFIRRKDLEAVGYLNAALKWGLDNELWIKLSAIARPAPVEHVLAASREYGETKTSSGMFTRIEELRQLGEQFSGVQMTPGSLCYFIDTLYKVVQQHPELYPGEYLAEVTRFWASTSALFARFGADAAGTPTLPEPPARHRALSRLKPGAGKV